MGKEGKTVFVCNSCGAEFLKWSGKCTACGEWNSLAEIKISAKSQSSKGKSRKRLSPVEAVSLSSIGSSVGLGERLKSGYHEFDRTLGGGFVPGQVVLLAGEPGIGKSTLLLQIAERIGKVLYVAGEESPTQIKNRAERLGISGGGIEIISATEVEEINSQLTVNNYELIIVDSIQTLTTDDVASSAGSVAQVKECARRLTGAAKEANLPVILVGHVNKEGEIAGPKVLEHVVDTVLYLEGERTLPFRLLRAVKNRFGDPSEVGVWQMSERGFKEVKDPGLSFTAPRGLGAGTVLTVALEGNRPLLLEVQALTTKTAFGYPRRTAVGYDVNRLYFLIAVLEKHLRLTLQAQDIYVNVTGGLSIEEPAADLAVALAIISSFKNSLLKKGTVAFGEVGLTGELREGGLTERRRREAERLGFKNVVSPTTCPTLRAAVVQAIGS